MSSVVTNENKDHLLNYEGVKTLITNIKAEVDKSRLMPIGTSSSTNSTTSKTVTVSPAITSLTAGTRIAVKFSNAHTASSLSLNVNGLGAKTCYFNGAAISSSTGINKNNYYEFVYDGTYWRLLGGINTDTDTNTWRTIKVKDTSIGDSNPLNLKEGDNITLSHDGSGNVTISAIMPSIDGGEMNVQSDWNVTDTTSDAYIKNKPNLATVATSGSYNDLSNKPTIPTSLKNPYSLTIKGNGTTLTTYNGSATKTVDITAASIGAASTDDIEGSLYKTIYAGAKETSNPGILVKTSVGGTSNAMISVKITGNAYCANGGTKPILTLLEFYNYYNGGNSDPRIINISGTHFGTDLGTIKLFNYDNKVCLWIPQTNNYQSFNVFANWTNSSGVNNNVNVVESLTKNDVPSTATYLVEFTPKLVAYDGDATSSDGGHTHTINATTSTTEVASKTHSHTVTATGNVESTFTGTSATTSNNTSGTTVASSGHTHDISGRITVSGQRDTTNLRLFNITFSFSGSSSATTSTTEVASKTHSHTVTATGNVESTFTGTSATTSNNTSGTTVASSGHTHTTSNDGSHSHTI